MCPSHLSSSSMSMVNVMLHFDVLLSGIYWSETVNSLLYSLVIQLIRLQNLDLVRKCVVKQQPRLFSKVETVSSNYTVNCYEKRAAYAWGVQEKDDHISARACFHGLNPWPSGHMTITLPTTSSLPLIVMSRPK